MVTTVKVGAKELVTARMITALSTMTFTELLALAIADQNETERTKLAALPIKVAVYTSKQHLSTQKADVQLSGHVSASILLGYSHVVFCLSTPEQQPTARPSANVFEGMMGPGALR